MYPFRDSADPADDACSRVYNLETQQTHRSQQTTKRQGLTSGVFSTLNNTLQVHLSFPLHLSPLWRQQARFLSQHNQDRMPRAHKRGRLTRNRRSHMHSSSCHPHFSHSRNATRLKKFCSRRTTQIPKVGIQARVATCKATCGASRPSPSPPLSKLQFNAGARKVPMHCGPVAKRFPRVPPSLGSNAALSPLNTSAACSPGLPV